MRTSDFDYDLPPELIAQHPAPSRDQSRLLAFHRATGQIEHRRFPDLPDYLRAGDVLVLNNSKVIPARLRGVNARTGSEFELLLFEENSLNDWWAMMRPAKRAPMIVAPCFWSSQTPAAPCMNPLPWNTVHCSKKTSAKASSENLKIP